MPLTADSVRGLSIAVIGAGALGLGFLGPELATDGRVTFLDVAAKGDLLDRLREDGRYALNQTGLSMRRVEVRGLGAARLDDPDDADAARQALDAADLVFTAVGEPNLPALAPLLGEAASRRDQGRPLRVLCGENGVQVAARVDGEVRSAAGRDVGRRLLTGDTVMGRMCKIVADPEPPLVPAAPGLDWAVVAEPFFGIPVEERAVAGLEYVPSAIQAQAPAGFAASEDVKMLSHNGLHATLGCLGHLRGAAHFPELRAEPDLMEMGRRLLVAEAGGALLAKHAGALDRNAYLNYCDSILRRITCPVLKDSVERGVRGIMRKLEPWERLVYSLRTVAGQGIRPRVFGAGLAAAVLIARRTGQTELGFRGVLTDHCGLDPEADAELLELVEEARRALSA